MISDVIDAVSEYLDAKAEHDRARDSVPGGGRDWGYFGSREIYRVSAAKDELERLINKMIDARIALALNARATDRV